MLGPIGHQLYHRSEKEVEGDQRAPKGERGRVGIIFNLSVPFPRRGGHGVHAIGREGSRTMEGRM